MLHCPGKDLAGTQIILFHSGTVPGNPRQLVTLVVTLIAIYNHESSRRSQIFFKQTLYNYKNLVAKTFATFNLPCCFL